jgi:trigger factor
MKVTVETKKGLEKNLKVFVDKNTINKELDVKYDQLKNDVVLKGFRPGKVPRDLIKRQFGKAIYGEVIDKILKETTTKALDEKKIKPALQPKIDLKQFGEGKDLEYVISVTEMPKVKINSLDSIKYREYKVNLSKEETDKRIKEIASNQKNFVEVDAAKVANEGDLVTFDYKATVDGKEFKGSEGKNTQLELGKDLFIKGFDKQLLKAKKDEEIKVEAVLPEIFPEKELVGKKAMFMCKIISVKKHKQLPIDDEFAKKLGAKDLTDLKNLVSKQLNDQYKNSLDQISKNQILEEIENFKTDDIPSTLIEQELNILNQGLDKEAIEKNKNNNLKNAKKRIKLGLILNQIGEENNIKVENLEIQSEIQKQIGMMPGQEKLVMDYYQKNPEAAASLRGNIYEQKIIEFIKSKAKKTVKEIDKSEAEKILKEENEKNLKAQSTTDVTEKKPKTSEKKPKKAPIKKKAKKVSKK